MSRGRGFALRVFAVAERSLRVFAVAQHAVGDEVRDRAVFAGSQHVALHIRSFAWMAFFMGREVSQRARR